jgi:hypothetical protein
MYRVPWFVGPAEEPPVWQADPVTWHAYADESMRADPVIGGYYLLVGACINEADRARARLTVLDLAKSGQRFHWHQSSREAQTKAVATVAALPALPIVVVGIGMDPRKQERARRHCLGRLLPELEGAGIGNVWLESRTQSLNARDRRTINALSAQRLITGSPHVEHGRPSEEPLLWVADIVAGAVNASLGGDEALLAPLVTLIERHELALT